jgi:hypothetical protein
MPNGSGGNGAGPDYAPLRTADYDENVELGKSSTSASKSGGGSSTTNPLVDSPPTPSSSSASSSDEESSLLSPPSSKLHSSSRKLLKTQNQSLKALQDHVQRISNMSLHISNELELQNMEIGQLETEMEEIDYESNDFQRLVFNLLRQEGNCQYITMAVIILVLIVLIIVKYLYKHHYIH